jgi:hypothetical protein
MNVQSVLYYSLGGTGGDSGASPNENGTSGGYNSLDASGITIYAGNGGGGGGGAGDGETTGSGGLRGSQARTIDTILGNDTGGVSWALNGDGGRGGDGYYYIRIFYEAPP